ncbi:MFS transporter [Stenotrophomonas sp. S48]|uniref:MFS transporter n=1 Tax=unclassified Stenotrophomonas TaxID=196198 RepID=UPI001E0D266D|nr:MULTISPECIES: MFS transporter [unclassified Stenotrophomonas]MBK0025443.1 MFS transporter [Stenotrophomonas sp. S48]MBK0048393.1 MFS transporter [Stenotrophomonas sp. S49]
MSSSPTAVGATRAAPLFAMAVAAGLGVANIYYNQPMLAAMAHDLGDARVSSWIPALTQLGYAAGLLLLLPLGDRHERRRLIVLQFLAVAVALVVSALAPGLATLAIGAILLGAAATVAQQIVPFTALLVAPERRGAAIGTVMSGLLAGILLSRTLAGLVSSASSWRAMFWLGVPLALGAALLMARSLPRHAPPGHPPGYGALLGSLRTLWRDHPLLRRATWAQALLFASFSVFWTTLSLHLAAPPLQLGAATAGLFGIIGVVGVAIAPMAGRLADRRGPAPVVRLGVLATLVSWLLLGLWPGLAGLVLGVVVLDFGVQVALVSHQHQVYGLHPEFKSRLNTVFMTGMFLGGAFGSWAGALAWHHFGWTGVAVFGGALPLAALAVLQWRPTVQLARH